MVQVVQVEKDLEELKPAAVPVVRLASLPSEVVPEQLELQRYFQLAEVAENDGGAAFVVDESDCDDGAAGSFRAAGSSRDRHCDLDSTGQVEYLLVGVKHCATVGVHEAEGETPTEPGARSITIEMKMILRHRSEDLRGCPQKA